MRIRFLFWVLTVFFAMPCFANEWLAPFAGSTLIGEYHSEYEELLIGVRKGGQLETVSASGRLASRIYRWPDNRTAEDIARSLEQSLTQSGFEILLAADQNDNIKSFITSRLYGRKAMSIAQKRDYESEGNLMALSTVDYLTIYSSHYLSARKTVGGQDVYVAVLVSPNRNDYLVDTLGSVAVEADMTRLNLAALNNAIESQGHASVYDIYFERDSARITDASEPALNAITAFLTQHPNDHFYVVGHTDDAGSFSASITLSRARAEAVKDALLERGIDEDRLDAHGAGPLSPLASNRSESGRELNRRVELVLRLRH
ncbi:MAG: OmpA family protein [Pseudomonadota bacterium]|nr:OmpA family protein [Pseudomonadota bacterium]